MNQQLQLTPYAAMPNPLEFIEAFGTAITQSRIFSCESIAQGKVLAMTCLAKQCDPLTLAETYDIIQGKLSMKSDAMLAGFEEAGGEYEIKQYSPDGCSILFKRNDQALTITITWEEAQQEAWPWKKDKKNLKDNWATPIGRQDMLWARVVSRGVRRLAPGVVCGRYTPEEIRDFPESEATAVDVEFQKVPQQAPAQQQAVLQSTGEQHQPGERPAQQSAQHQQPQAQPETAAPAEATGQQPQQVQPAAQPQAQSQPTVDDRVEISIDAPATEDQRKKILSLMGVLKQEGVEDIGQRVKTKLERHGLQRIGDLTVAEADALTEGLQMKNIEVWAEKALVGHKRAALEAGSGND